MKNGRIAKCLVVRSDGQILLLTIGENTKYPHMSWQLDLPGGIIEDGETTADGMAREIHEETGIVVEANHLRELYEQTDTFDIAPAPVSRSLWLARVDMPDITLSYEHDSHRWVTYDELVNLRFHGFYFDDFIAKALKWYEYL